MNNKVLAFVLIFYMGATLAHCHTGYVTFDCDPCVLYCNSYSYYNDDYGCHYYEQRLPSEKQLRRQLYWLYRYNPRSLELKNFPVDYFLSTLTDHIRVLEHKILQKRTGLRSASMLRGTILSLFSALLGYLTHDAYKKSLSSSSQDTIGGVVILGATSALLAAIAGTQFDRVYCYVERLRDRLERDKQIRATLERIKFLNM